MKGLRRRIRSGQDKKMLEGADICMKSQSPAAAAHCTGVHCSGVHCTGVHCALYTVHCVAQMKSQSLSVAVQVYTVHCVAHKKSQSLADAELNRCTPPPATYSSTFFSISPKEKPKV